MKLTKFLQSPFESDLMYVVFIYWEKKNYITNREEKQKHLGMQKAGFFLAFRQQGWAGAAARHEEWWQSGYSSAVWRHCLAVSHLLKDPVRLHCCIFITSFYTFKAPYFIKLGDMVCFQSTSESSQLGLLHFCHSFRKTASGENPHLPCGSLVFTEFLWHSKKSYVV